ncbi:MAG: tetratricopeptide repeat protein, partial [Pseudobdellovibrionaceae bacterium]
AYTMIGKSHAEKTIQKDSEKIAIENLKKAIEISPKFEPAYLALATFYEKKIRVLDKRMQNKKKNYYELRLLYQEMAEKFPKKPQYQAQVCKIDALDEQLDHAKDSCRKAMIGNPKDPTGYVYMGIAHQKAKENDEAKRLLSGAVKRFKRSDLANLSWANFLESQGNVVDAYSYFKTVTEINPETADGWSGLARTGMQLSKEDESMQAFRKACSLNPQQAGIDLRKSLGYAKKLRGQLELLEESCR